MSDEPFTEKEISLAHEMMREAREAITAAGETLGLSSNVTEMIIGVAMSDPEVAISIMRTLADQIEAVTLGIVDRLGAGDGAGRPVVH